ncbi:MAG: plasmid replication protein RepC [Pseudomonadota bacterium]
MTHDGWRKPTPGLVMAEHHAQAGEQLSIPKSQAIVALKKVATALGLKPSDMMLLDTLSAFTQAQDWEEGRRPIVWASNAYLMEQTGFSLAALKRHIRKLGEFGLISFKDSTNGKRWGHRDDDGYIVEAYGFDLAPLAARAGEFETLHAELREEREFCKSLRNLITISRRVIRAKIEKAIENALRGPWSDFQAEFVSLLGKLPTRSVASERLLDVTDQFRALRERVEAAFAVAFDWPERADDQSTVQEEDQASRNSSFSYNTYPKEVMNEPHILDTNHLDPVPSKIYENIDADATSDNPPTGELDESSAIEQEPENWNTHESSYRTDVEIETLMSSCPHFAEMARDLSGWVKNWNDLHRAAGKVRPIAGISEDAWKIAQQVLGPYVAAASIALIFDKHSTGEVSSPGGYLRGMVEKAKSGDLHLDRSIYGRLNLHRGVS